MKVTGVLSLGATATALVAGTLLPTAAGAQATIACTLGQLRVTSSAMSAAAGHQAVRIHFRNVGESTCTMFGYPGIAGLDAHGNQIEQAVREKNGVMGGVADNRSITTATLRDGQVATAIVQGSDVPQGGQTRCGTLHGLLVTPPDDYYSTRVNAQLPACGLQVHPVVKGSNGSDPAN